MSHLRAMVRRWRALAGTGAAVAAVLLAVGAALALDLAPGERATVPGPEIRYLRDPGGSLTLDQALAAFDAGQASPIERETAEFGHAFDSFWLFVTLTNVGDRPGRWHVATRAPFAPALAIDVRREDGSRSALLDLAYDTPYADRPVPNRFLISNGFQLAAGERADLVIAYSAGGGSSLPFSIESEESLRDLLVEDGAVTAAFYAFSAASILLFVLGSVAMRSTEGLLYAAVFAAALLLLAQLDGLAFQFLWPDWPVWNAYSALPLLLLVCGLGFFVAGHQRNAVVASPRFRRLANGLALLSLALIALVPVGSIGPLLIAGYVLLVAMLGSHVLAILPMVRQQRGLGLTGMMGAGIAAVGVGALIVLFLGGIPVPALLLGNIHRIAYLLISLTAMLTLSGHVMQMRRDHERALEREVAAARRDAELNRELFESEKNYARARELAARRQRQLATATHDIRQPLASLRLSLDALAGNRNTAVRAQLREAFDYLEGLTGAYLAEARDPPEGADDAPELATSVAQADGSEPYPLSLVTGTIDQMFREEAISKGLAFRVTGAEIPIEVPVLPLMRLVSNLVSNAIKYTDAGSVAVTAGRADEGAFIAVEDTGPGMAPEALAELRRAGRKGEGSQGEGLGLAIADDVAARLGITVEVDSAPGAGTRFRILLPAARATHPTL